jgi:DnaJ-class molecular chaperone
VPPLTARHHPRLTLSASQIAEIMDGPVPDYYATLGVGSTASPEEIRGAYKKESLRSHPDRFPNATTSERQRHTARFQSLADAYYVLSDTARRAEYDSLRRSQNFGSYSSSSTPPGGFTSDPEKEQESSYHFFRSFFGGAASSKAGSSHGSTADAGAQPQGASLPVL